MLTLILILLAHLLYDFHWQGPFIAENKGRYPFLLFIHALTWTLIVTLPVYLLAPHVDLPFQVGLVFVQFCLFVSHWRTDNWKSKLPKTPDYFWAIYVDQGIHFATLLLLWGWTLL